MLLFIIAKKMNIQNTKKCELCGILKNSFSYLKLILYCVPEVIRKIKFKKLYR